MESFLNREWNIILPGWYIFDPPPGRVGFLVKEYLCDIIEVIKDTKFDGSIPGMD